MPRAKKLSFGSDGQKFTITTQAENDQKARTYLEAFDKDDCLVQWFDDRTAESAIEAVQDPFFLAAVLELDSRGLEYILSDRHAREAFKKALLADDDRIVTALRVYSRRPHRQSQGGRPAKIVRGQPVKILIAELTERGFNNKLIAKYAETTPNSVRAQKAQARKTRKLPASK